MGWIPEAWSPECWSLPYFRDRLRSVWYERTHPQWPWLTPEANRYLAARLDGTQQVLEVGAGGSTIFFARRSAGVTSVESSTDWKELIIRKLQDLQLSDKVTWLADGGVDWSGDCPGPQPNVMLVDGGNRLAAAEAALRWLPAGGWLVVDNINRFVPNESPGPGSIRSWGDGEASDRWQAWWTQVTDWPQRWTGNGVTDTWLGIRPPVEDCGFPAVR